MDWHGPQHAWWSSRRGGERLRSGGGGRARLHPPAASSSSSREQGEARGGAGESRGAARSATLRSEQTKWRVVTGSKKGARGRHRFSQKSRESVKNDYSQHFVDTGDRPQNFVRDAGLAEQFRGQPCYFELNARKDRLVQRRMTMPLYHKCNLKETDMARLLAPTRFDVVLIDPPWPEYARRCSGMPAHANHDLSSWTYEEMAALDVGGVAASDAFVFLWVGAAEGLDLGRRLLKHWGFRRVEDIIWAKTNKAAGADMQLASKPDDDAVMVRTKEHCLVGKRGNIQRDRDGQFVHCNTSTDVIIDEEPSFNALRKPLELYHVIERFCLGRRRLELFAEDHNIRPGWVSLGSSLSNSNFDAKTYAEPWAGERFGQYLGTTRRIEALRPREPTDGARLQIFFPEETDIPQAIMPHEAGVAHP